MTGFSNCPEWISIGGAQQTFDAEGQPADPKTKARMEATVDYFLRLAAELAAVRTKVG